MNKSLTQPNRSVTIPDGATHWAIARAYCFYRIDGKDVYNYIDDQWHLMDRTPPPRKSAYHAMPVDPVLSLLEEMIALNPIEIPIGSERVMTIDGPATRLPSPWHGYIPDVNPYDFEPVYYYPKDIWKETTLVYMGSGFQECKECGWNHHDLDLKETNGKCPECHSDN